MSAMDDAYALIVGIAEYLHVTRLPAAVRNDARDVRGFLVDPRHCGCPPDHVTLLLDGEATREAIIDALSGLAARAHPTCSVLLYISSHGGRVVSGAFAGEYILPVDAVLGSDGDLARTAISGAEFTAALKAISARKMLVIFDCCHAGGLSQPKDVPGSLIKAGLPDAYYERLAAGRGRAILSSSRETESSYVLPAAANSLFTQHLLAGLNGGVPSEDGLVRVFDLFEYVQPRVTSDQPNDLMTSILWPLGRGERVEIAPLRSAALREAITRPAAGVGVYLEPLLVERLLRDAGEEPGALSLVQETMVLLWERMTRRLLTVSAYEDLGGQDRSGLAAALATRADAALASLSAGQRAIARRIFLRLVQLGEGRQDTGRPQAVGALRAPGDDPALFDATLRHLTDRRLMTMSADSDEPTVDLGHEAMITHWPALGDWIEESRAGELARRRIERDSEDWRRNGRDRGELYRRRKLADALELAAGLEHELSQNAVRFLAAGRRRRLLGLLSLGIVAVAALGWREGPRGCPLSPGIARRICCVWDPKPGIGGW